MVNKIDIQSVIAGLFVAALVIFGGASLASAATTLTHLTLDGDANTTVGGGETIEAEVTLDITGNDDVESVSVEVLGTGLPKHCENVADKLQDGTYAFDFDFTAPETEGTWDVQVIAYGTNGEGTNQSCTGAGDDTETFSNRVTVDEDGESSSGSSGGNLGALDKLIALLTAWVAVQQTPPAPPAITKCTALASASVTVNGLQNYLMANGEGWRFQQAGVYTATGYYGPITAAAVASYKAANGCQ